MDSRHNHTVFKHTTPRVQTFQNIGLINFGFILTTFFIIFFMYICTSSFITVLQVGILESGLLNMYSAKNGLIFKTHWYMSELKPAFLMLSQPFLLRLYIYIYTYNIKNNKPTTKGHRSVIHLWRFIKTFKIQKHIILSFEYIFSVNKIKKTLS